MLLPLSGIARQDEPGTNDDGFVVRITAPASIAQTLEHQSVADAGKCYWTGSTYGPSLTADLCGEVVWAFDQTPDSLACDSIPGDLTGKIALIRRGGCTYSRKVYMAQRAGAIAVIILNHFTNIRDQPCITYGLDYAIFSGMPTGEHGNDVRIPSIFLQRATGTQIAEALKAGQKVAVCFRMPRLTRATAALQYATPVLHVVDTMKTLTVHLTNREATTITNVVLKADIKPPYGPIESKFFRVDRLEPGADTMVVFPGYAPLKNTGKFEVVFSSNLYTEPQDTLRRYFEHTEYTFALDNLVLDTIGVGFVESDFETDPLRGQGCLYWTGPSGLTASRAMYVTFGLLNADSLFAATAPDANLIMFLLLDGDKNEDGLSDLKVHLDEMYPNLIGQGVYEINGKEVANRLIHVPLTEVLSGAAGIPLKPNHPYYIVSAYTSSSPCAANCIRFSSSRQQWETQIRGMPSTPIWSALDGGMLLEGWAGATLVQRLEIARPASNEQTPPALDAFKVKVLPNPADDYTEVQFLPERPNKVEITIAHITGRILYTVVEENIQNQAVRLDTKSLAAGTYLVWIRTGEGWRVEKLAVVK